MADTTYNDVAGAPAEERVDPRRLIAFLAMVFGMFMAILDIQIVSASLAEIQAGLNAGADEISWVQTSYLIAEVIMIPLSGTLARILSTRILFSVSAAGFTAASVLAATATNIDQMIVYRAIQGFIGGGMIPSVFAAAYTIFPRSKQAIIAPIIGLVATLAPTIGPTVGGYLSSNLSWHWLFLINVGPGIAVATIAWTLIDFDQPEFSLAKSFDWLGFFGMAVFLGALEYVLEEGPANDWLSDETILFFAIFMVIGAVVFFYRAFTASFPVVDLTAFRNINFAFGSVFSFVMGIGLYGLVYLYPLYLGRIRGYDSLMIGETVFITGIAMFLSAPFSGALSNKVDPRLMLLLGFLGFAYSTWMLTGITSDWDYWELFLPQIIRGASLMFCMVTITNLALGTLPVERLKAASGLFNLTRNLGGAVGLAAITTLLSDRSDLHYAHIAETVTSANHAAVGFLDQLSANYAASGIPGDAAALSQLAGMASQQAWVMSFADVSWILAALFASLALGALLMKKPQAGEAPAGH
ncbi:MAG: MFS transporter [Ahrensia sp.]|nr:MFS transporter [Ahrensia sp.]